MNTNFLIDLVEPTRRHIQKTLEKIFSQIKTHDDTILPSEIWPKLKRLSVSGKYWRGTQVILAYLITKKILVEDIPDSVLYTAAGMELLHTALLIHDDIMDRSPWRRGQTSLHYFCADLAKGYKIQKNQQVGISLALSLGDYLIGQAFKTFGVYASAIAETLSTTALAQCADVWSAQENTTLKPQQIISIYQGKTAQYSCSMPLKLGAMIADAAEQNQRQWLLFGKYLGIAYQLADDELDIFGDRTQTGKPIGQDITEGKQTVFRYSINHVTTVEEKKRLQSIWGKEISTPELSYIRDTAEKYGIPKKLIAYRKTYQHKAAACIPLLTDQPLYQQWLHDFIRHLMPI